MSIFFKAFKPFLQNIKKYVDEKIENEEGKTSIYPRITLDLVRFEIERKQYESARRLRDINFITFRKNFVFLKSHNFKNENMIW